MDDSQREQTFSSNSLAEHLLQARSSRRAILRRATALGLSMPVLGGLLAACGDDDDEPTTAPAATTAPGGEATPTEATTAATPTEGAADATPTEGAAGATPTTGAADATPTEAATSEPAGEGQPGGTMVFGLLRDPIAFDPHINYGASSSSLQGNVYDTLIEYAQDGTLTGSLAEQWEVSGDGLEYTLALRQGVTYHDGASFEAEDVIATFDRIMDEETGATRRPQLSNVASYEAEDDATVVLRMNQPYATLLAVLATSETFIADKDWLESGVDVTQNMNGTGPFMLDSFEPNVRYVLVKNPNYWKPGLPYLDRIEQVPIPDDAARVNALRSGEINFVEYVPWQNMAELNDDPNYNLYQGFDLYNIVRLNPQRPPLDDKLVRQALNFAIDRQAVIDVAFGGQGEPITVGLFQQVSPWFNEELAGHWEYDPDRAMSLLEEAGVDPSGITLDFAVATISVHSDTAQVVAQYLQQLGFGINIIQQDVPTLTERRTTGDYQMMQDGLSLSYPDPDAYSTYFSIGGAAHAAGVDYENERMDELLKQGREETDRDARQQIYLEFERELLEDAPWIFILFRPQAEASIASMRGYERIPGIGLTTEAYMEYVWIDE